MLDHNALGVAAGERWGVYALLSALYLAPPSADIIGMAVPGLAADADADTAVGRAAIALAESLRAAAFCADDNALTAEHTRLFVLPSGVVPNESVYVDKNRRLGGRVTVAVRNYYRTAGAELGETCLELPDHIGIELQFMQFLCGIEQQLRQGASMEALGACLAFQREFLAEHLLRWHQPLCQQIRQESPSGLYCALADLTGAFLEAEGKFVSWLTTEIDSEGRTLCAREA